MTMKTHTFENVLVWSGGLFRPGTCVYTHFKRAQKTSLEMRGKEETLSKFKVAQRDAWVWALTSPLLWPIQLWSYFLALHGRFFRKFATLVILTNNKNPHLWCRIADFRLPLIFWLCLCLAILFLCLYLVQSSPWSILGRLETLPLVGPISATLSRGLISWTVTGNWACSTGSKAISEDLCYLWA